MSIRDIVRKGWQMTQAHLRKLIWYGAVPAFFSIIVSSGYIAYQYNAFKNSVYFSEEDYDFLGTISEIWELVSGNATIAIPLIIAGILVFLGNYLIPSLFQGILIKAVSQIHHHQPVKGSAETGLRRFFPMFEFGLLMGIFKITALFSASSFTLRWWGVDVFFFTLPFLLFVAVIGFVLNFLFNYTEYFIILRKLPLIQSMKESAILVVANLRKTFIVFILLILISLRMIVNAILVLLIPMIVVALAAFVTSTFWSIVSFVLIGLFSLGIVIISAYLLGIFNIITTSVWVLTFHLLADHESEKTVFENVPLEEMVKPL